MDLLIKYLSTLNDLSMALLGIFLGLLCILMLYIFYLACIFWWEYWGQWMFNRIVIVSKKPRRGK